MDVTKSDLDTLAREITGFVKIEARKIARDEVREHMKSMIDVKMNDILSVSKQNNIFEDLANRLQGIKGAGVLITSSGIMYIRDADTIEIAKQALTNMEKEIYIHKQMQENTNTQREAYNYDQLTSEMREQLRTYMNTIAPVAATDPNNNNWSSYKDNRLDLEKKKGDILNKSHEHKKVKKKI